MYHFCMNVDHAVIKSNISQPGNLQIQLVLVPSFPNSNVLGVFHLLSSGLLPKPIHWHGAVILQDL